MMAPYNNGEEWKQQKRNKQTNVLHGQSGSWNATNSKNLYYLNLKLILWPIKSAAAGSLDENKNQKQLGEAVVNIQERLFPNWVELSNRNQPRTDFGYTRSIYGPIDFLSVV